MAKHNLEVEPEEGYELVQVISEERGKVWLCFHFETHSCLLFSVLQRIFCLEWQNSNLIKWCLSSSLCLSELVIPDNANVFYAMNTSANFDFLLRMRGSVGRPVQLRSRCSSTLPRTQHRSSLSLRLSKVTLWPWTVVTQQFALTSLTQDSTGHEVDGYRNLWKLW